MTITARIVTAHCRILLTKKSLKPVPVPFSPDSGLTNIKMSVKKSHSSASTQSTVLYEPLSERATAVHIKT